jgi:small conductance mechanosensitive channel
MKSRKLAPPGAAASVAISWMAALVLCRAALARHASRAFSLAMSSMLVALAASIAFASPAVQATPALTLPTFQELITPAAPASAPDAASASTPAMSDAEMLRSLGNIISTLDSDKQRAALVSQLKHLREAKRAADDAAPATAPGAAAASATTDASATATASGTAASAQPTSGTTTSSVVATIAQNAGLLGAIASALTNIEADVKRGKTPFAY